MALRPLANGEAEIFAGWEAGDRPYPWTAAHFREATRPPTSVLIQESSGRLDGYAVVQIVGDEAYLQNLMVAPALRRQGIGGGLLQKVIMWARDRGARRLVLDVADDNAAAIRLYESAGFLRLERRRAAYPRGEDALVMKKDL